MKILEEEALEEVINFYIHLCMCVQTYKNFYIMFLFIFQKLMKMAMMKVIFLLNNMFL